MRLNLHTRALLHANHFVTRPPLLVLNPQRPVHQRNTNATKLKIKRNQVFNKLLNVPRITWSSWFTLEDQEAFLSASQNGRSPAPDGRRSCHGQLHESREQLRRLFRHNTWNGGTLPLRARLVPELRRTPKAQGERAFSTKDQR